VLDDFGEQSVCLPILRNRLHLVAGLPELLTAREVFAHTVEVGQSIRNVVFDLTDERGVVMRGFVVLEHKQKVLQSVVPFDDRRVQG